jgi:hypothetical protein
MQAVIFNTAGDGYWSNVQKAVEITDMKMGYVADDKDFGELCVYFNTADWDVNKDGLIYTDSEFLHELNAFLVEQGLCAVEYSEQGMQGDDYVSLDVEDEFIALWERKFNTQLEVD